CISVVGILTGAVAGLLQAYCTIKISIIVITGFNLPFRFPFLLLAMSVPVVIVVALISAWIPAKQAANMEVAEAIDYE
ncbi:MAG: hypothetical protein KDB79_08360, partial [Acidobacteria bacterium]|nr:hypothetical protein [Acidobacteriota bacterium]